MKIEIDTNTGCIGFAGLLTIIFIVLKLLGVISWGWIWIFAPMWITAILLAVALGIIFLAIYIVYKEEDGRL